MTAERFVACYRIGGSPASIDARAQAIAVEQSVEMPIEAIDSAAVLSDIVGQVQAIQDLGNGLFDVRIALAAATVGVDAGQLLNMAFGNTSLHADAVLYDLEIPEPLLAACGGPRHGVDGLRQRSGAFERAFTCSAIKPQGLPAEALGDIAGRFACGGIDFVKDDHGLADQAYSPFARRVEACANAVRQAGSATRYVPSLSGDLDQLRRQIDIARNHGVDTVMIAPMLVGWSNVQTLIRQNPDMAYFAHPTFGGAARVVPQLLIGKLFRLLGADVVIFPNHGGRFGYSPDTCRSLAERATQPWSGVRPSVPAPAGGMTLERVPEMLDFYGRDAMLLIGGSLLAARDRLTEETLAFTNSVVRHAYR